MTTWKAAATVAVAAIAAAFVAGAVGTIADTVRHEDVDLMYDIVAATFLLGVLPLLYVLPLFLGATFAARTAARRGGSATSVLGFALLVGALVAWFVLSFALPQVVVLTYLGILFGASYVRLCQLLSKDARPSR